MSRHRMTRVALALLVAVLPVLATAGTSQAVAEQVSSAETKKGTGRFENLEVTVSQTQHLRNQVVEVSWKGFKQTTELTGDFTANYLQIMQCWGGENAPKRETCQFGGLIDDGRGGINTNRRYVTQANLVDEEEDYKYDISKPPTHLPFEAVNGKSTSDLRNEYYDAYSTNEMPYTRTAADGTGREFFEIQTAREAPGLGCGARLATGPRPCWLVVVPRDDIEVDGRKIGEVEDRKIQTSPLSQGNFNKAIFFKLEFEPIGLACPIGSSERRLLGHEEIAEAVTRWQPALCSTTGTIFGFNQIGDGMARNQVLTKTPWFSMVTRPVVPDRIFDGRTLVYAPLTVSGIGIALNIDRVPRLELPEGVDPDTVNQKRATRVVDLKLTPRLVAKLLTQSYSGGNLKPEKNTPSEANVSTMADDPEFLQLNPEFRNLFYPNLNRITNPLGLADANRELWAWIAADKDARDFVAGWPDPWGMTVNAAYKGLTLDREDFPRADPECKTFTKQDPMCPLDAFAYAADFHEAGRAAARGETLQRRTWNQTPPQYKKDLPQFSGERNVLAIVDTATAARYKLPMASLKNQAGRFVAPTEDAMSVGLLGMKGTEVPGVIEMDPANQVPGAYPLTSITYGVTAPQQLTVAEAKDYAAFVNFATTTGQTPGIGPGQLPEGYVPLPPNLRAQAAEAAKLIAAGGPVKPPKPTKSPTPKPSPTAAPSQAPAPAPVVPPVVQAPVAPQATSAVVALPDVVAASSITTPSAPAGGLRLVPILCLLLGLVAAAARPVIWLANRPSRPSGSRRVGN